MEFAAVILGTFLVLIYSFLYALTFFSRSSSASPQNKTFASKRISPRGRKRALIAIAHPDDEVMFFGPTILNLLKDGFSVYILCFSYGNAEGLGLTRKEELWASCRILGVPDENVTIVKHDKLRDSQKSKWPVIPLTHHLTGFVESYGIDTLVTFDQRGVSGHPNHISVYNAALDLVERSLLPSDCDVYSLNSMGFVRQYLLNVFNLPIAYFFNSHFFVADYGESRKITKAMKAHRSQMLWFRHLHVTFSAYMYLNALTKMSW